MVSVVGSILNGVNLMKWIIPDAEVIISWEDPRGRSPRGASQLIIIKAKVVLSSLKTFIEQSLYSFDKIMHMSDK